MLKPRPLPHPRPLPSSRSRRRHAPGSRSAAAQSPPQSARSGQCSSRIRRGNCRRNSSSAPGPAGGETRQGAAAAPGLHPSRPSAPHVPARSASATSSFSRSRAPRDASSAASRVHSALKSGLEGPSAATSGKPSYLRRGRSSGRGRGKSVRTYEDKPVLSCTPSGTPGTPYPRASRSRATAAPSRASASAPSMKASPVPAERPLRARGRPRPWSVLRFRSK